MKDTIFKIFIILLSLVLFIFIFFPLVKIIFSSDWQTLKLTIVDHEVRSAIFLSLKCALIATFFTILTGIPLAYLLARWDFKGKALIEGIIDLPVMIPHTAAGIALLTVFGPRFLLGSFFKKFGLEFMGTEAGIVIGMMFVSLSYLVNQAKEGFKKIDLKLENVARSLGAPGYYLFFNISIPLAKKEIICGAIMMWARGISEFGAVVILTYHPMTAPVLILERFQSFGLQYSRPIAVILIVICIIIFSLLRWLNNKK